MKRLLVTFLFLLTLLLGTAIISSLYYTESKRVSELKEELKELKMKLALERSRVSRLNRSKVIEERALLLGMKREEVDRIEVMAVKVNRSFSSPLYTLSYISPLFGSSWEEER